MQRVITIILIFNSMVITYRLYGCLQQQNLSRSQHSIVHIATGCMSAWEPCRHVARLRRLLPLGKDLLRARPLHQLHGRPEAVGDEQEEREVDEELQHHEVAAVPGSYRLQYNPLSYPQFTQETRSSRSKRESEDDELCLSTLAGAFRQQSNHYSVSSSRWLSSTKNTLVDLAFSKASEEEPPSPPSYSSDAPQPDVKGDPRAFQRCRPEYASMTLDLSCRPHPINAEEAFLLLHKVTVLKGSMDAAMVTEILQELGHLHTNQTSLVRGDTRFIMLLRYAVENLQHFTDTQLLQVLQAFVWLGLPSRHSMLGLYEAELSSRAGQMGLHQLLLAADLWRCLGRQVPEFLKSLYDSVSLHLGQVGIPELIQLLYVIGESRQCPANLVRPVEQLLMQHLYKLQPEEVGTVCLGLFKSQMSLPEAAVYRLVDKAHSVVADMSDYAMVNVLKLMRFSWLDHMPWLKAMAREVPRRAPEMGVQGLMHVALASSALHYRDDRVLNAVAERLPSLASHCRSKDSAKLLWAFGTMGVLPSQHPALYSSLTHAMRQRKAEFQRHPEHLLTGLLGLAFVSELPEDLLELALSPEFISLATQSSKMDLRKDLFTLDGTVGLELPHWTGPRLGHQLREEVAAMLWKYAQSDVCLKPEVQEAECALQDLLGGPEFVSKRMILPHTRSIDLEVHLDPAGRPMPVRTTSPNTSSSPGKSLSTAPSHHGWEKTNTGVVLTEELLVQLTKSRNATHQSSTPPAVQRPPPLRRIDPVEGGEGVFRVGAVDLAESTFSGVHTKPDHRDSPKAASVKLAVQASNRSQYCYRTHQLMGLHAMKRRQLQLTGYRVVELPHWEWMPLLRKTRAEKLAYLHCKIYVGLE